MTNKYIRIKMKQVYTGGTLTALASFKLDNVASLFNGVEVKIDTGCSVSTIPLIHASGVKYCSESGQGAVRKMCRELKQDDLNNGVEYLISYGVETGGRKHIKPVSYDGKVACEALKFKHGISNFKIDGVDISTKDIYVNYDRVGNILIGMDILKNWDIHIGESAAPEDSGKTVFLACPYDNLNEDYFKELDRTFLLSTATVATKLISEEDNDIED